MKGFGIIVECRLLAKFGQFIVSQRSQMKLLSLLIITVGKVVNVVFLGKNGRH